MEPVVAFDESGNSGAHLLDAEQPAFVLASVRLSDAEAAEVLPARTNEYKFATMKRSRAGQRGILSALSSSLLTSDSFLVSGTHKRYLALTKMVDLLIEPLAHRDGIDLYSQGANIAMSNMLYFFLPPFLGVKVFDELLSRFVTMVRWPDSKSIDRFYRLLETGVRKHRKKESVMSELGLLLATRPVAQDQAKWWDSTALDPAIPAFVEHASIWTGRIQGSFSIMHDVSKPLAEEQLILEAMMSATEPRGEIGYDRRKMHFPIAARGIDFCDSRTSLQLQVADLIASAAAYCLKAAILEKRDEFSQAILETPALSHPFMPLWPERKVTPEELGTTELGGVDANDYVGNYISNRLGGIPPKGERRKT